MYIDVLTVVLVLVLAVEVFIVFQAVRKLNDSELQSACAGSGPSVTFKQKSLSSLIGGNSPFPGDLPASDLTVTAQLNCEQDT
jgi:hypothetical protein